MIRHRKGNFFYGKNDMSIMKNQINSMKLIGIKHIAFGSLNQNNRIHIDQIKMVSDWAHPMKITFHKAIDLSIKYFNDIELLQKLNNVESILTSGCSSSAEKGYLNIKKVLNDFENNIKVVSAGRITKNNLTKIHKMINGTYYHGRKILGTSSKACYLFSILGKRGSCFWIFFSNTNLPHSKSRFIVPSAFITDSVRFGITGLNSNEIILIDSAAVYKTLPAFLISVLTASKVQLSLDTY